MDEIKNLCSCKNDGLFLSLRETSWVVSGLLIVFCIIFITGYFLGQKKVLEQFSSKVEQDSLSDKIYSSIYSLYDSSAEPEDGEQDDEEAEEPALQNQEHEAQKQESASESAPPSIKYYAQLVGYGSSQAAYSFTQRLAKKNIDLLVKKHQGRTARGTVRTWYQVVTHPYDKKESLMALVEKLKHEERLKNIRIVTC